MDGEKRYRERRVREREREEGESVNEGWMEEGRER
jgi:hypothetical protein